MKKLYLLFAIILILGSQSVKAEVIFGKSETAFHEADTLPFMAVVSLWFEAHKNNDFNTALTHAWEIIDRKPDFSNYKFYSKMEEMLIDKIENSESDELKKQIADTLIYVYDLAIENDQDKKEYHLAKKAYALEIYTDADPETVIDAYKTAIDSDPQIDEFYKDRLGLYMIKLSQDIADYKMRAIDYYSKLAENEPDNVKWNQRLGQIVEDPVEFANVREKAWRNDPQNTAKAWEYAQACLTADLHERSIEPLQFLTEQNPDVINYWRELSSVYEKLGKDNEAITVYKTLIELQPDNRDNYLNLAIIYQNLGQLSVARSYLQKASNADPSWSYPYYIEGQLYEKAVQNCSGGKLEFMDKVVYQLIVDTYEKASSREGQYAQLAANRAAALKPFTPEKSDYFFRNKNAGDKIEITGSCYAWIGKSITVPNL